MTERTKPLLIVRFFLGAGLRTVESSRFLRAVAEGFVLQRDDAREHGLLYSGPAFSLPGMIVIRPCHGTKRTIACVAPVVMSTITDTVFGAFAS